MITKEWFEKRAAQEGDLEIGAGRRTMTLNLTPEEIAVLERLVDPSGQVSRLRAELESERQRNAALIEEVRKVIEPFGNSDMRFQPETGHAESEDSIVAGICDFTYGDLLAANAMLQKLEGGNV